MALPHSTPEPELAPASRRRLLLAAACAMFVFGAGIAVPAVCLETFGRELNLSLEQRGLLFTARMGGLIPALLLIGWLARRHGKRPFLLYGLLLTAASQILAAAGGGYSALALSQAAAGAGKGAMEPLLNQLVTQLSPRNSARSLNLLNALSSLGVVVAAITAGEILQAGGSWRIIFWAWAVPTALCALFFSTRDYPAESAPVPLSGVSPAFWRDPLYWLLALAMLTSAGVESGLVSWGPNFVASEMAGGARDGALTIILFGSLMTVGRFASGLLVHALGSLRLMLICALACLLATAALTVAQGLWPAWALFALGGLFIACFWPTLLATASEHLHGASAALFASLATSGVLGCMIIPWAIGYLGDLAGLRRGMQLLPAALLILILLLLTIAHLIRHRSRNLPPAAETSTTVPNDSSA